MSETTHTPGPWEINGTGPFEVCETDRFVITANLAYPEAERELTLDFHAFSIAANVRWTHETVPQLRVAERASVERAYRQVAAENNLKVHQLQAITWEWWRKTRKTERKGK